MSRRAIPYTEPSERPRKRRGARRGGDDADDDSARKNINQSRWWREDKGDRCAGELWNWLDRLRPLWSSEAIVDLIHESIYRDEPLGIGWDTYAGPSRWRKNAPANLNAVKMMVDAATARLTKRRPMPVINASDANWTEKRFAKRASRVLRVKMGSGQIEKISPLLIRDFCIRGTAAGKISRTENGDTQVERQPIYEFVWDPREAYYGEPRTLGHVKPIDRDVLIESFPEYAEQISKAPAFSRANPWIAHVYQGPGWTDHIEVAEAWHLPSGKECEDGQHVIAIHGCVLLREPWTRPRFPVPLAYWSAPLRGLRGDGLARELAGIQAKINDVMRDIEEMIAYQGKLKIFVQRGSATVKQHLRAKGVAVVEIDGAAPVYSQPIPALAEAVQFVEMLLAKAEHLAGFNEMALSSKNVLGANASGKAIDTLDDIQSDRFAHVESGWQRFRCDLGVLQLDEARCMWDEVHGKYKKRWPEQPDPITEAELAPWVRELDWRKIDIDAGSHHLTVEPANFLPESRAGRLSFVAELAKGGLLPDPTMTADLFDEPDISAANRSILGPKHNIDRCMEDLADPEVDYATCAPDVHHNLELYALMCLGELNEAEANRAPDDVLERYRNALTDCKRQIAKRDEGLAAPSLPGMQSVQMGPSPNASDLLGGGGAPPPGPGGPPMPMPPPGGLPS